MLLKIAQVNAIFSICLLLSLVVIYFSNSLCCFITGIPPSYQPVPAPMTQGYVPLQRIGNLSGDQLMQGGVLPVGTGRTPSSSDYFSYQPSGRKCNGKEVGKEEV